MASMAMLGSVGVAILLLYLLIMSSVILVACFKKSSKRIPPGRVGWPLIGESIEFATSPCKFVLDRMIEHSPHIFKTSIGGQKMAVFCGVQGNKFYFSNEDKFALWLPKSFAKLLGLSLSDLTSPTGKLFADLFHTNLKIETVRAYASIADLKAREHVEKYWLPNEYVKVQSLVKDFTFSLACNLFLDIYDHDQIKDLAELYYMIDEGIISIPVNIPGTTYHYALKASKVMIQKLEGITKQRVFELSEKSKGDSVGVAIGGEDLLSKFIKALSEDGKIVDEKVVVSRFGMVLFSAFHTTSSALAFALHYIAQYPQVYARVLQENLEIMNSKMKGEPLSWEDIQKMKYSWNVVLESLRLQPPGPAGGFREVIDDFSYEGFVVPKGWKAHWTLNSTYKDPKYFPDPEKFDPTRFEQILPYGAFMPFGGGPRMCSGMHYARIELLAFIYNVVTRFKLQKANPNEKIYYTPNAIGAEGLRMCLRTHDPK